MSWICYRCETENKEDLLYCEVCEEPSPFYSEIMREEEAWNNATQINTEDSYSSYLRLFPDGKHQIEVQRRLSEIIKEKEIKAEEELWAKAVSSNTISAYDLYIKSSKKKKYLKDANKKLEELLWSAATVAATEISYRDYLQKTELKTHKAEAERRLDAILWEVAVKKNTLDSYREYKLKSPIIREECEVKIKSIESSLWSIAVETDTISGYEKYLGYFNLSYHSSDARKRISELQDDECWSMAVKQNTLASYNSYLSSPGFINGLLHVYKKKHRDEAHKKIEELLWQRAIERNTLEGYCEYKRNVKTPRAELIKRIEELEEQHWEIAQKTDSIEAYDKYLKQFPSGRYILQAKDRIKELTDIGNDEVLWSKAKMSHSLTGFRNYLVTSTLKIHEREAEERINEFDRQDWEDACKKRTIGKFQAYLKKFPNGIYRIEAMDKIHRLERKGSIMAIIKILLVLFAIASPLILGVYLQSHSKNRQHKENTEDVRSGNPFNNGSTYTGTGKTTSNTATKHTLESNTTKIANDLEVKLKAMETAKKWGDSINPTTLRDAENLLKKLPTSHSSYNKYRQRLNALKQ